MKNIQTKKDLDNVSETWYQRTNWLRRYYQDEGNDKTKRMKAAILFQIMLIRMKKIVLINIQLSKPKIPIGFKPGGIISPQPTA